MLGNFFSKINTFFNKNLLIYFSVLCGIIAVLFWGLTRLRVDQSIYSVFPKGEEFREFNEILRENKLNRQLVFTLNTPEDEDQIDMLLDDVSSEIQKTCKAYLSEFRIRQDEIETKILDHFHQSFPAYLNLSDYDEIEAKLTRDSIRKSIQSAYERLSSASGLFLGDFIAKDPLNISWKKIASLNTSDPASGFELENGITFKDQRKKILFFAYLDYDTNDSEKNLALRTILDKKTAELNHKNKQLQLDYFGTFLISSDNAQQIQADNQLTLLISIALIVLILVLYYRSLLAPFYFIIGPVFGGLVGLGMLGFIHPDVSGLSLATSAVLLGIVLDYSFHFFTHFKHSGSLSQTVREITFPMLVGSFTTIAAFFFLIFTNSTFLQDFGIFAVFCLSGTALFDLIFLPTILQLTRFSFQKKEETGTENELKQRKGWKFVFLFIMSLFIYFLFNNQVEFDEDLNNLSFHSEQLKNKENELTGLNPEKYKKVYLFSKGENKGETEKANFEAYQHLLKIKEQYGVTEIISTAPFLIPEEIQQEKTKQWSDFWENRKDTVIPAIHQESEKFGFSETAFLPFEKWIETTGDLRQDTSLLESLGLTNLIYTQHGYSLITSVIVDKAKLSAFKNEVSGIANLHVIDLSDLTSSLLKTVKDDFNYLLLFSSLMVFISLLVIYGRLELAILAFLPMVISWVLILGSMTLFDVKFNFVNIIIASIIFGLGDDYSIFVTDGLLQKYKHNTGVLKSYSSAIILSAVTTVIGTGVFFFAKHPAIHSIAFVSVTGIGIILIVSLYIQPALFRTFVLNRTEKKNPPLTIFVTLFTGILYLYFLSGCLALYPFMLLVALLPLPKKYKRIILNTVISKLAKSVIYFGVHIRKNIDGKELLNLDKPSIIIANHASFLDILLVLMLSPKITIMVKKWVYRSPMFGLLVRNAGYLFSDDGPEKHASDLKELVKNGYSVVIFPEGTRSKTGEMGRFHKGAFLLAHELQLDIQPLIIHGAYEVVSKNDMLIKSGEISLKILPRIRTVDGSYGVTYKELTKNIAHSFKKEFHVFKQQQANADFLFHRIKRNYVLKGPVLEWYIKIKWRLEKKNFEFYDSLIGERKIIADIGCGYGYLSYYLHYRNGERIITGMDYDREKINIARNGFDKTSNLNFVDGDILDYSFQKTDIYYINDVLHYLSLKEQNQVLQKCYENLNPNGMMVIRDGVSDFKERHQKTKLTELFSTKIMSFNKNVRDLSFFSIKDITDFAHRNGLHFEMIDHSKKTSNVLFILRKPD